MAEPLTHRAAQAAIAILAFAACFAALAYASVDRRPDQARPNQPGQHRVRGTPPPRPRFTEHPQPLGTSSTAIFGFTDRRRNLRFRCRLDHGSWRPCHSPVSLQGLGPGPHRFSVRAVAPRRRQGSSSRFTWQVLELKPFSISPGPSSVGPLYPGAPALPLPVRVENPNAVPIYVTELHVSAANDPPGCDSGANLELIPSSASSSTPLEVPANGALTLPAAGLSSPAIRLRDLPVNQDACRSASFRLDFSGRAYG